MIGETGERKSAVATPDGKSRKKKKKLVCQFYHLVNVFELWREGGSGGARKRESAEGGGE